MATTTITPTGFFKLPAELRNEIYELVFDSRSDSPINLLSAVPPPKDLLLVCREIHSEAEKLYKACYRNFWSENEFVLEKNHGDLVIEAEVKALDAMGLDHIRNMRAYYTWSESYYNLLDTRGAWALTSPPGDDPLFYLLKQRLYSGDPYELNWDTFESEDLRQECARRPARITMHEQLLNMLWY